MKEAPRLAGVLGWPIAHSRSPALHGHWLKRYDIAGHYIPLGVPPERLEAALAGLEALGFRGVNVTLPHKEAVLAQATTASDVARRIGAANTLTFLESGGFHADNTDASGFRDNIAQAVPDWRPDAGPALVLGAGGAARAVIAALMDSGVPELRLANRTRARAEVLRDHFGPGVTVIDWAEIDLALEGATTLVNTTSLGMTGQAPLDLRLDAATAELVVNDIVYQPLETDLLRAARARNLRSVDGLGMLLHQAAPGFERWFGRKPEVDAALRAAVLAA
jgi:shikimate dehydrogenase